MADDRAVRIVSPSEFLKEVGELLRVVLEVGALGYMTRDIRIGSRIVRVKIEAMGA